MKRILKIGGIIAAFLCLSQNVQAQYVSQIHRDGDSFVDDRGYDLSDKELVDLIGEDIYYETVVGARKQYNAGNRLIRSGAICGGVGLTGIVAGAIALASSETEWDSEMFYDGDYYDDVDLDGLATAGIILMATGSVLAATGAVLLDVGIPFRVIGQSRLNWVENDYNERNRDITLHFGAAPSGIGLTLTF